MEARFGTNRLAVDEFIESLQAIPWFSRVGQPTPIDIDLIRVDFDFMAQHHANPYSPWGLNLPSAESKIERLVFDNRRLGEFMAIQQEVRIRGPYVDDFYLALMEKYPGYYGEFFLYAHELVDTPDRLIRGAAHEIMLADLDSDLRFFQGLMPWFRQGHWPCGWEGSWPEGRLILW